MIDSIVSTPAPVLLPDWLMRCAENFPDRLALHFGSFSWSFAELDRQVTRLAQQLASLGIAEGMRVALLAGSGLPYVVCVHALTRLGAVLVPLNVRLTLEELCWQLNDVRPALLISDEGYQDRLTEISQRLTDLPTLSLSVAQQDEDVLLCHLPLKEVALRQEIDLSAIQAIMYTSGTTGQPKGALITFGMQWWNAVGSALNMGHSPEDRWLACMPLFHVGGLSILMKSVIYGIGVVLHERFDPAAVNAAIVDQRVTIISVVAVMLQRMLAELEQTGAETSYPETLRCVLLGGGPAPRVLLEACRDKQIPVVQTYGLTESCSQAVTLTSADALRKLGSAGRPLPPVQLRIVHEDHVAAPQEAGEIQLKGPTITPGYAGRPDATAKAYKDGWFATGDLGYLDEDGYLYVLDRRSDLIISGGENVYPAEIEAILLSHPDVMEAGVCAQDDPQWGQVPIAFVHLHPERQVSPDELKAYAARSLARYKQPQKIYFVEQLPRNSSGKLLRRELPQLLERGEVTD